MTQNAEPSIRELMLEWQREIAFSGMQISCARCGRLEIVSCDGYWKGSIICQNCDPEQ